MYACNCHCLRGVSFIRFFSVFKRGLDRGGAFKVFAAVAGFSLGAYVLWVSLKIEFDREAIWKSATASITMGLSLFALELLRVIVDPSSYQFLVLRLRLLPVYAVVGVVVYLLSLIVLKAVKTRDTELPHDYLPLRL